MHAITWDMDNIDHTGIRFNVTVVSHKSEVTKSVDCSNIVLATLMSIRLSNLADLKLARNPIILASLSMTVRSSSLPSGKQKNQNLYSSALKVALLYLLHCFVEDGIYTNVE